MGTIHIYSVAYNRADFISLQYASVLKYIQPFNLEYNIQFWLMINTKDSLMRDQLVAECKRLKVQYIVVPIKEGELYNGGLTAYNYIRDYFFKKASKSDYSIVMDSDMFFYNKIDFEILLTGNDVAAIYHQRQKKILGFTKYNFEYLWVGFMVFSHKNFDWSSIRFDPIEHICDVGGMTWYFLKEKQKAGLKVKWLNHTPDITIEYKEIFPEPLWRFYKKEMGFQIIEDSIIHYYRGSNWDNNLKKFIDSKHVFLKEFLKLMKGRSLDLHLSYYYDSVAYSRKHYNGKPHIIKNEISPSFGDY